MGAGARAPVTPTAMMAPPHSRGCRLPASRRRLGLWLWGVAGWWIQRVRQVRRVRRVRRVRLPPPMPQQRRWGRHHAAPTACPPRVRCQRRCHCAVCRCCVAGTAPALTSVRVWVWVWVLVRVLGLGCRFWRACPCPAGATRSPRGACRGRPAPHPHPHPHLPPPSTWCLFHGRIAQGAALCRGPCGHCRMSSSAVSWGHSTPCMRYVQSPPRHRAPRAPCPLACRHA